MNNNESVEEIDEIRVEGNRERPKNNWMEVIREDIRECGVGKEIIGNNVWVFSEGGSEVERKNMGNWPSCTWYKGEDKKEK